MMGVSSRSIKVYECDQCGKVREEGHAEFGEYFEIGGTDTGHIYISPANSDSVFSLFDESEIFVDSLCFCSADCLAKFVAAAIEQHKTGN